MPITTDMLIEFAILIGVAFAIFKAGSFYTIWKLQKELIALEESGDIENYSEDDEEGLMSSAEVLDISKQEDQFFAYGANSRFIGQDNTLYGLLHSIAKNEPGKTWLIGNSDDSLNKEEEREIMVVLRDMYEKGLSKDER